MPPFVEVTCAVFVKVAPTVGVAAAVAETRVTFTTPPL
jgi:hypothetical protein